jgi:7-cyano-7-deazaguanine synthase
MIMLSVAIGWAVSTRSIAVAFAAHSGDHTIYPDCRESFANAMHNAAQLCDWHTIALFRPFIHMTKGQIVKEGARLKVPFEKTWSCYVGADVHCGKCGTCVERREAFELARVPDPTPYASID